MNLPHLHDTVDEDSTTSNMGGYQDPQVTSEGEYTCGRINMKLEDVPEELTAAWTQAAHPLGMQAISAVYPQ